MHKIDIDIYTYIYKKCGLICALHLHTSDFALQPDSVLSIFGIKPRALIMVGH